LVLFPAPGRPEMRILSRRAIAPSALLPEPCHTGGFSRRVRDHLANGVLNVTATRNPRFKRSRCFVVRRRAFVANRFVTLDLPKSSLSNLAVSPLLCFDCLEAGDTPLKSYQFGIVHVTFVSISVGTSLASSTPDEPKSKRVEAAGAAKVTILLTPVWGLDRFRFLVLIALDDAIVLLVREC
jgi:hypothetical protein